jgi:hypothetical protein
MIASEDTITIKLDTAVEAIAANYRIGSTEAAVLGLLSIDGEAAWRVIKALIDYDGWMKFTSGELQAAG